MATPEGDAAKLQILKDALYDQVRGHGSEQRLFTQKEMLDLKVIPGDNLMLLMKVIQSLCNDKLLVASSDNVRGLLWRWRNKEEAKM